MGAAIRCGAGTDRTAFALANGAVKFRASRRRSSERVPPVRRASSGPFASENRLAVRSVGRGLGNWSRWVTGVTDAPGCKRSPGKEAWRRAILLGIVAICPSY
jgi:hypothetical protein